MNPDFHDLFKIPEEPTPQKIFTEIDDLNELVMVRKQDIKVGVGMSPLELETAIAVLTWVVRAGAILPEIEQTIDDLSRVVISMEGK